MIQNIIAERLADLSRRIQSRDPHEVQATVNEVRDVVIRLEPVHTAVDALALQCLAMDIARLMAEGQLPQGDGPALDLMRSAIVRTAHFLEGISGQTIAERSFLPATGPAPVMQ